MERSEIESVLHSNGTYYSNMFCASHLMEELTHQASSLEEDSSQLQQYPGLQQPFSFEELFNKCQTLYSLNEKCKELVEVKLGQYGYEHQQPSKKTSSHNNHSSSTNHSLNDQTTSTQSTELTNTFDTHQAPIAYPFIPFSNYYFYYKQQFQLLKSTLTFDMPSYLLIRSPIRSTSRYPIPEPRTPTLEDFGISSFSLQLCSEVQTKGIIIR